MTNSSRTQVRALRGVAGSALRWITTFDPFDAYASTRYRRP
jgi:hypothetical protein